MSIKKLIRGLKSNRLFRVGAGAFGSAFNFFKWIDGHEAPFILLSHNELSGTTAIDETDNEFDFTYLGSPALGVEDGFEEAGLAFRSTETPTAYAYYRDGDAQIDNILSVVWIGKIETVGTGDRHIVDIDDVNGSGRSLLLMQGTRDLKFSDGSVKTVGRTYAQDQFVQISYSRRDGIVKFYENGVYIGQLATTEDWFPQPEMSVGGQASSDGFSIDAENAMTVFSDIYLPDLEHYEIAKRSGMLPQGGHFFVEKLKTDLAISRMCEVHHPLWEEDAGQVVDISGKGNHVVVNGAPSFKQGNSGLGGNTYSVFFGGAADSIPMPDDIVPAGDFTFFCRFKPAAGALDDQLFSSFNSPYNLRFFINNPDQNLRLQLIDNSGVVKINMSTGFSGDLGETWNSAVLRRRGETYTVWLNGTEIYEATPTGSTYPATATTEFAGNSGGALGDFQGNGELVTLARGAVPKEICEDLSTGLISSSYAPAGGHYLKEVIDDELDVINHLESAAGYFPESTSYIADLSGNDIYADLFSGTVGEADIPADAGLMYSMNGRETIDSAKTTIDPATDDFTLQMWIKEAVGGSDGVFGKMPVASGRVEAYFTVGTLRFDYYDNVNPIARCQATGFDDGEWHCYVFKVDHTTKLMKLWVDGELQDRADFSNQTLASTAAEDWRFGFSYLDGTAPDGVAGRHLFKAALKDRECARLSQGKLQNTVTSKAPTFVGVDSYNLSAKDLQTQGLALDENVEDKWQCRHSGIKTESTLGGGDAKYTEVGGLPAVYDGDLLFNGEFTQPCTVFMVVDTTGMAGTEYLMDGWDSAERNAVIIENGSNRLHLYAGTSAYHYPKDNLSTGKHIIVGQFKDWLGGTDFDDAGSKCYLNDVPLDRMDCGGHEATSGLRLFARYTGANGFTGAGVHEIAIHCGRELNEAEIYEVTQYLQQEWNMDHNYDHALDSMKGKQAWFRGSRWPNLPCNDWTNKNNHCTSYGGTVSYADGLHAMSPRCFDFSGSDWHEMTLANTQAAFDYMIKTAEYSVSFWFEWDEVGIGQLAHVFGNTITASERGFAMYLDDRTGQKVVRWVHSVNGVHQSTSCDIDTYVPDGSLRHFAFVANGNGNTGSIYIDGVEVAYLSQPSLSANATETCTVKFRIGQYAGGTYGFDGRLDDLVFFNRSLTAQEVQDIYNNGQ